LPRICSTTSKDRLGLLRRFGGGPVNVGYWHNPDLPWEKGPQAEILTPGWHPWFLVNVIYQVENKKVISIPSGKYGSLNAKDGQIRR
jgi:hypothetical protein